MAWRPVLEEMGGAMKVHELKKLLVEHCHVAITVHCRLGGQKVDRSSAALAAKAAPDHHTGRMFDINNSKALLVTASQGRPSNFLASRVDDRKYGLVRKHDCFPVLLRPGSILLTESQSFPNNFLSKKGLLGCRSRWQAQSLVVDVLDRPDGGVRPPRDLQLQLFGRFKR
jgi:hypothetical protein